MPKAFTQSQIEKIRLALLQKGREYFIKYGLKKTSVDDIAKAVGIAKGSFYRFFESKEALFLALHEVSEEKLRTDMMRQLEEIKDPDEKLRFLLKSSFAILEEDPLILAVFGRGEMESFSSFFSSEQYEEHYHQNITFIIELISRWQQEGIIRQLDAEVAGNMIASVFFIYLQKETLGTAMYDRVTDMLIETMVNYLSEKGRS
ncbi:MAG: TetR/AcrR family transcriptional regulator [Dehalococcoidales bacterium]|nr:TetR/AcrR family transcriptional regulator [Dehalococcoidales bacterium]